MYRNSLGFWVDPMWTRKIESRAGPIRVLDSGGKSSKILDLVFFGRSVRVDMKEVESKLVRGLLRMEGISQDKR